MSHGPYTEEIRRLRPELYERFVRAVNRERAEALRLAVEQYGRPVRIEMVEDADENNSTVDVGLLRGRRASQGQASSGAQA